MEKNIKRTKIHQPKAIPTLGVNIIFYYNEIWFFFWSDRQRKSYHRFADAGLGYKWLKINRILALLERWTRESRADYSRKTVRQWMTMKPERLPDLIWQNLRPFHWKNHAVQIVVWAVPLSFGWAYIKTTHCSLSTSLMWFSRAAMLDAH